MRGSLAADSHCDDRLYMLLLHPVTGELPFVQLNPQFRLSDVADHPEVLDSVYGFQYVVNIIRRLFRLIEVMPEDFHGN